MLAALSVASARYLSAPGTVRTLLTTAIGALVLLTPWTILVGERPPRSSPSRRA